MIIPAESKDKPVVITAPFIDNEECQWYAGTDMWRYRWNTSSQGLHTETLWHLGLKTNSWAFLVNKLSVSSTNKELPQHGQQILHNVLVLHAVFFFASPSGAVFFSVILISPVNCVRISYKYGWSCRVGCFELWHYWPIMKKYWIQKIEGRDVNIERPRKNPPNSTAVQSRVNERASSNLQT